MWKYRKEMWNNIIQAERVRNRLLDEGFPGNRYEALLGGGGGGKSSLIPKITETVIPKTTYLVIPKTLLVIPYP